MTPFDPLSVVLVTTRFWPLADERALRAMAVARRLAGAGVQVTVLTPQWDRQWPLRVALDGVEVVRLKGAPCGGLASLRWYFHLARWLRRQRPAVVGVLGVQQEAGVALAAARRGGWPTVLFAEADDPATWEPSALGRRVAAAWRQTVVLVAPSARLAAELARRGGTQVELVPWAADTPPRQGGLARDAARRALAEVNPDLVAPPALPVVLTVAPLAPQQQLEHLIGAWPMVAARRPDARLWIVGDGPLRARLYRQIQDLDLRFRVLLPGTFDSLQELCHAADALLVPHAPLAPPLALVEGMAAGLSIFLPQSPLGNDVRAAEDRLWLFTSADRGSIAQAVLAWLDRWQPPSLHGPAAATATGQPPQASADDTQAVQLCRAPLSVPGSPPSALCTPPLAPPTTATQPNTVYTPADEGQRLATLLRRLVAALPSHPSPCDHPAPASDPPSARHGQ